MIPRHIAEKMAREEWAKMDRQGRADSLAEVDYESSWADLEWSALPNLVKASLIASFQAAGK